MPQIRCEPITAENFSGYGLVVDTGSVAAETINDGSTRRYADLASFDLGGATASPTIGLYVADARRFPLQIIKLERHRQAAQLFIPQGLHSFVIVVAPGAESPEWENARAFLTAPGQCVSLHRGTWHHGLIALHDGDRFVVMEGSGYRTDTEEVVATEEIWLASPAP